MNKIVAETQIVAIFYHKQTATDTKNETLDPKFSETQITSQVPK